MNEYSKGCDSSKLYETFLLNFGNYCQRLKKTFTIISGMFRMNFFISNRESLTYIPFLNNSATRRFESVCLNAFLVQVQVVLDFEWINNSWVKARRIS